MGRGPECASFDPPRVGPLILWGHGASIAERDEAVRRHLGKVAARDAHGGEGGVL